MLFVTGILYNSANLVAWHAAAAADARPGTNRAAGTGDWYCAFGTRAVLRGPVVWLEISSHTWAVVPTATLQRVV